MSKEKQIKELAEMIENWIRDDLVKATETYKYWQHDKGSLAYGYYRGLKAVLEKLNDIIYK